jgi:putative ABC transport system permease protein
VIRALLADAYQSLTSKPGRTAAMLLGIVLGVASAVAAIVIADTEQGQINRRFDLQRSSIVVIQAGNLPASGFSRTAMRQLRDLPVVTDAGELSIWRPSVDAKAAPLAAPVRLPLVVADPSGLAASGAQRVAGVAPDAIGSSANWVWVGQEAARRLGLRPGTPSGILIQGRGYTVAGYLSSTPGFDYLESSIVMARATAQAAFGSGVNVRAIAAVRPGSAREVGSYAVAILEPARPGLLNDITPPDGEILLGHVTSDLRTIGLALGASIALLGIVGIANTLTSAVHQRTRELGLRGALGWSRRQIAALVLLESAIAGTIAGVIGSAAGLLAGTAWCTTRHWDLVVLPTLPILAIGCSLVASILGGVLPAVRAASITPLTAMRS